VLRGIDPSAKAETVYPGEVGDHVTVAAFAERWIEKNDVSHNVRLTCYIIPKLGARPIGEVTTDEIAEWLREIDKRNQPALTAKIRWPNCCGPGSSPASLLRGSRGAASGG
jgi:hypothetical protein